MHVLLGIPPIDPEVVRRGYRIRKGVPLLQSVLVNVGQVEAFSGGGMVTSIPRNLAFSQSGADSKD